MADGKLGCRDFGQIDCAGLLVKSRFGWTGLLVVPGALALPLHFPYGCHRLLGYSTPLASSSLALGLVVPILPVLVDLDLAPLACISELAPLKSFITAKNCPNIIYKLNPWSSPLDSSWSFISRHGAFNINSPRSYLQQHINCISPSDFSHLNQTWISFVFC